MRVLARQFHASARTFMKNPPGLPPTQLPIFTTCASLHKWRLQRMQEGKSVGFVPTMGALHDGHLSLGHHSVNANDYTVFSIFVNPAQFAPHEDLGTYPRTLESDLKLIEALPRRSEALPVVFLPSVQEMYPLGISQNVEQQKGTFVEVKGYGHQMEGKSRPLFFRGVATVVTKLFNAVLPTNAYFGQKDIQQALLLRRMVSDLLSAFPSRDNVHIIPTARDQRDGLALSSRNAYLSPAEREVAGTLYAALQAGEAAWKEGGGRPAAITAATNVIEARRKEMDGQIRMELDYVEMNDPETFEVVDWATKKEDGRPVILSGALWVGRTRLIDNIICGDASSILT